MPIRLSILGATGKMGKRTLELAHASPDFLAVAGTGERPRYPTLGQLIGDPLLEAPLYREVAPALNLCDVAIDFTLPQATLSHLEAASIARKPLVIGTSGHSQREKEEIVATSRTIPILFSPNFSLGMALCLDSVAKIGAALLDTSTIDIIETHHIHKKDTPSGTALALAKASGKDKTLTSPPKVRSKEEVLIHAIRSGEVIGEHTVIFECAHERIELRHTAHSRDAFAHGALMAARFLATQPPGLYTLQDLFHG